MFNINDQVKVVTEGQDPEKGEVVTINSDGTVLVHITTKNGVVHPVWFNADGTEYRIRYGSVIQKVFDAETEDGAEPWTAEEVKKAFEPKFKVNDRVAIVTVDEPTFTGVVTEVSEDGEVLVDFEDSNGQGYFNIVDGVELQGWSRIYKLEELKGTRPDDVFDIHDTEYVPTYFEPDEFTVVIEVEGVFTNPGVITKEVEIVEAGDSKGAADYVRGMYEHGDDDDPYQVHSIEVHPTTEAEKLLKSEIERLQQRIWDDSDDPAPLSADWSC